MRPSFVIAFLLPAAAVPAAAQTPPKSARPWSIDVLMHYATTGPAEGMTAHLQRVGGYDGQDVCFVSCRDYPSSAGDQAQLTIAVARSVGKRVQVRAFAGGGKLGWTSGDGDSGSVAWHWSIFTAGALLALEAPLLPRRPVSPDSLRTTVWLGAGPIIALLWSGRGVDDAYPSDSNSSVTRFGAEAQGGIRFRAMPAMSIGVFASYRLIPSRPEGPYSLDTGTSTLPAFESNYSTFTFGVSLGFHFRL